MRGWGGGAGFSKKHKRAKYILQDYHSVRREVNIYIIVIYHEDIAISLDIHGKYGKNYDKWCTNN